MILLSILGALLFLVVTCVFSTLSVFAAFDRSGKVYLWFARTWSQIGLLLFGIRLRVLGTEHIEPGRNYVYVANHSSYMDIPVLLAGIPDNLRLTLRRSLTRIPIWGWALLASPFLILDRSNPKLAAITVRRAAERIRGGASVLFFPEGTRTPTGAMQAFKRGAFHLALESGAAILPVAILGTYEILPRNKWLPLWGKRVTIKIGEAIQPYDAAPENFRTEEIRVMKETEAAVRTMLWV
ncbi:MAG TPA: lysophospholipid acyltransferase family protein [Candidatus Kapabacteria bacterium]|nr:lysophospholipid acyltransferase family protein [Candidatus Kapabacteria bacterium]